MSQTSSVPISSDSTTGMPAQRLTSLDAFRGLTMALMVLVNNAGSGAIYHQFKHAEWNGWTVADTVFPSFVWIVGVAITLSLGKRVAAGVPNRRLIWQVLRRSVLIFVFGIIVYLAPRYDLSTQRILGVLQRIAICYLVASLIYLYTGYRAQIAWTLGLLVGYWMLMTLVPVPGYGAGDLSVAGNLAHYVDRIVLGSHNYASTKTWDPEGIVSTLPAIATALLGVLGGYLLQRGRSIAERSMWFVVTGAGLMLAGLVCDIWLPINKHLWTSSFTLFMAGLDFFVFAVALWLVDGCGYRRVVKPLVVFGLNAIAVYMVSELLQELIDHVDLGSGITAVSIQEWIYRGVFLHLAPDQVAALLYAVAYTALMYVFAYALYRKKWFLRL